LQSLSAFFCFFRAGRKRDGSTPWTWVIHTLPASHAYRISYPSSWEPISALSVQGRVLPLMLPRNMGFQAGGQKVKNSTFAERKSVWRRAGSLETTCASCLGREMKTLGSVISVLPTDHHGPPSKSRVWPRT
jgi:hypothetical protein